MDLGNAMLRLGLGTAQFGLDYGISNTTGRVPVREAARVVERAAEMGVRYIDTAAAYGEAEKVLGEILPGDHAFRIVTKPEPLGQERVEADDIVRFRSALEQSLVNLRHDHVYAVLMHSAEELWNEGGELLVDALLEMKSRGLVKNLGVSIYSGAQLDQIPPNFPLDIVQLPLNVFDQRMAACGHIARLKGAGTEIHVRSVFLQGLLLMTPDELPSQLGVACDHVTQFRTICQAYGMTVMEAALGYVLSMTAVDCALVGVCSLEQFDDICRAIARIPEDRFNYEQFAMEDESIINPVNWKDKWSDVRTAR